MAGKTTTRTVLLGLMVTGAVLAAGCPRLDTTTGTSSSGTVVAGSSVAPAASTDLSMRYPGCTALADKDAVVAEVLRLVNVQRAAQGLTTLQYSDQLEQPAMEHACEMITNNFFSHENPVTGSTPGDRVAASGFAATAYGENIAAGQATAQEVMDSWMNSTGHRANILGDRFTHLGVGVRAGGSYGIQWVQLFGG